jgi:hypothetical protein
MDALREYLKAHENVFVKVSVTRGDFESFSSKNYEYIEPRLDELEHTLGAKKLIAEFIVEEAVDDAVEIGYDGFCVDGAYPNDAVLGLEVKDKGYVGHVRPFAEMPKEITEFLNAISPAMKRYQYRNFLSTENRITKEHKSYMNDLCSRCGSPPTEVKLLNINNLADILWYGAEGESVDPEYLKQWEAQVMIDSFWSDRNWQAIQFPKEVRDNVKLRQCTVIEGQYYVIPQSEGSTCVGSVVGNGDTMEEAIEEVKAVSKQIEGYYLEIHDDALDDAQKELEKLKETTGIEL